MDKLFDIYLDNSATTKDNNHFFIDYAWGNPSSHHDIGFEAKKEIELARKQVANLINAEPEEIYFTSGGTESDNWALRCTHKKTVFTDRMEHDAITKTAEYLTNNDIKSVKWIKIKRDGSIDYKYLLDNLTKDGIVSVMTTNNEIGLCQRIGIIGNICRSVGAYFHTDAVQAFGKIPIDVKSMNIDLLSASGHKIGAGKGIGILYIRKGVEIDPLIYGGGQELGLRSGTENVQGIIKLGMACAKAQRDMKESLEKTYFLKNKFESDLILSGVANRIIPFSTLQSPYISTLYFPRMNAYELLDALNEYGIYVSSGSACANNTGDRFKSLKELGFDNSFIEHVLRFSFNDNMTKEDIDNVIRSILMIHHIIDK